MAIRFNRTDACTVGERGGAQATALSRQHEPTTPHTKAGLSSFFRSPTASAKSTCLPLLRTSKPGLADDRKAARPSEPVEHSCDLWEKEGSEAYAFFKEHGLLSIYLLLRSQTPSSHCRSHRTGWSRGGHQDSTDSPVVKEPSAQKGERTVTRDQEEKERDPYGQQRARGSMVAALVPVGKRNLRPCPHAGDPVVPHRTVYCAHLLEVSQGEGATAGTSRVELLPRVLETTLTVVPVLHLSNVGQRGRRGRWKDVLHCFGCTSPPSTPSEYFSESSGLGTRKKHGVLILLVQRLLFLHPGGLHRTENDAQHACSEGHSRHS